MTPLPSTDVRRALRSATPLVALAALVGMSAGHGSRGFPPTEERPEGLQGVVRPYRELQVTSAVPGVLEDVRVERGERVQAGQLLAVLESSVEVSGVEIARARSTSDTARRIARERLELIERRHERFAALHADDLLSSEELGEIRSEMLVRELELLDAHEEAELAELELLRAQALLDRRSIRSPVDGVVVERHLSPGELVSHSGDVAILSIAQLDPLRIDVRVPVTRLETLHVGMRAEVYLEPTGAEYEGSVSVVDPVADPASDTIGVRVLLPNAEHAIPAGLRCRVTLRP